ncbi:MAG TPA: hypothetical protein VKP30_01140 [Polyangiaceae bacterium]|nr:hypothetical protein [Polyangiaceae bacterium]
MGLYMDHFRFDGALPDLDAVKSEVERRIGSAWGLDGLEVKGQTVCAYTMLEPFTRPVTCAVLQELGGQYVDLNGEPRALPIPEWAHRPIREMRWSERMAVRYRWWAWFFGTARNKGRR